MMNRPASHPYNIVRSLISDVSALTGYPPTMLRGPVRTRGLAHARFAVMKAAYGLGMTMPQIGRQLNNRDHTSILYGIRRAKELEQTDPEFAALLKEIET